MHSISHGCFVPLIAAANELITVGKVLNRSVFIVTRNNIAHSVLLPLYDVCIYSIEPLFLLKSLRASIYVLFILFHTICL